MIVVGSWDVGFIGQTPLVVTKFLHNFPGKSSLVLSICGPQYQVNGRRILVVVNGLTTGSQNFGVKEIDPLLASNNKTTHFQNEALPPGER